MRNLEPGTLGASVQSPNSGNTPNGGLGDEARAVRRCPQLPSSDGKTDGNSHPENRPTFRSTLRNEERERTFELGPLANSTPRASSCRTKASNRLEAKASRKVNRSDCNIIATFLVSLRGYYPPNLEKMRLRC